MNAPRAFWCRTPSRANFGDALTPWLVRRLGGQHPRFTWPEHPEPKFFVCGSIAALAGPQCIVWGAGLMESAEALSPAASFLAVRGPRTRARALACGAACPPVLGDPALLLPRLLPMAGVERRGIGFVAHFADAARLDSRWAPEHGLKPIDIQQDVETVIREIASCEWLLSSSLHGLIVAHAYGVPAVRVQLWPLPSGDGTKFADHYESLGAEGAPAQPLRPPDAPDLRALQHQAWCPPRIDTQALWDSRPWRS